MAIAHLSAKMIGAHQSPVAAAAYRHRTRMTDRAIGQTFQFMRETDLVHAEIALPSDAPEWVRRLLAGTDATKASETLWNEVVAQQNRRNGQFAREIVVALPAELSVEQNIALMREFVATELAARGLIVDWVYHDKSGNPHVHLMHTLRALDPSGFGAKRIPIRDAEGTVLRRNGVPLYHRSSAHATTSWLFDWPGVLWQLRSSRAPVTLPRSTCARIMIRASRWRRPAIGVLISRR